MRVDKTGRPEPKFFRLWKHITERLRPGEKLPGGKPKPDVAFREAQDALLTLAGQWKQRFDQVVAAAPGQDRTPPAMIIVCDNTDIAEHFHRLISGEETVEVESENDDDEDDVVPRRRKKAKSVKRYGNGLSSFPEFWNRPGAEVTLRHVYEPDFVVRLATGAHILLEVKGAEPAQVSAKHQAAQRWVTAVNRWGRLGQWRFLSCHDPQQLLGTLIGL